MIRYPLAADEIQSIARHKTTAVDYRLRLSIAYMSLDWSRFLVILSSSRHTVGVGGGSVRSSGIGHPGVLLPTIFTHLDIFIQHSLDRSRPITYKQDTTKRLLFFSNYADDVPRCHV